MLSLIKTVLCFIISVIMSKISLLAISEVIIELSDALMLPKSRLWPCSQIRHVSPSDPPTTPELHAEPLQGRPSDRPRSDPELRSVMHELVSYSECTYDHAYIVCTFSYGLYFHNDSWFFMIHI